MPLPLLALAIAAFGIGTTEFVIMGLLPNVARDLGVSIPAAGMLVSGYALGVTIGAPILAIVTAKMPRKKALMSLMGVFIVGNMLCAIAPGYWVLMGARIVTAFCHGAFFGIGSVVAAGLVEEVGSDAVRFIMLMTVSREIAITAMVMVLASRSNIMQLPAPVRWTCSVLLSRKPSASPGVSHSQVPNRSLVLLTLPMAPRTAWVIGPSSASSARRPIG